MFLTAAALVLLVAANSTPVANAAPVTRVSSTTPPEPFAVVELFSSEGCSSCPPAEALLAELEHEASTHHRRVFTLEFHVDYWNSLGWTDPFSSPGFTRRQRDYTGALKLESMYTPQMIVNGHEEFVGSNRARANAAIAAALAERPAAALTLALGADGRLKYSVRPLLPHTTLTVAIVQPDSTTHVLRGENAGRTLRHRAIVREAVTLALPASGAGEVALPGETASRPSGWRVVAYVQDIQSRKVLAAGSIAR